MTQMLIQALEDIVNPIARMQRNAHDEGAKLDGFMAIQMSKDASYLQGIAESALNKFKEQQSTPSKPTAGNEVKYSKDQVLEMLVDFAILYHNSKNKDITNDAAEFLYDRQPAPSKPPTVEEGQTQEPDVKAFSKKVIDSLQKFYDFGNEIGYSNSELSRIRSCIEKVKEIKAESLYKLPIK